MIRRLLLAVVATGAFALSAAAADLPVAPGAAYYPPTVTPVPYYNWTGLYVGGNIGVGWTKDSGAATTDIPTGALIDSASINTTGLAGGGQIGLNWFVVPNYVIGVEGDFDVFTNKTTDVSDDGVDNHLTRLRYLSTARARLGFTADRFMLYATGGFAWGESEITRHQLVGTVNNAGPGTAETVDVSRIGWTVGTGVEYAFASNWTARLEYIYANLEPVHYTFPLAQRVTTPSYLSIGQLRFGINYKFGWGEVVSARD